MTAYHSLRCMCHASRICRPATPLHQHNLFHTSLISKSCAVHKAKTSGHAGKTRSSPLAILSTPTILRTVLVTSITSSPILFKASLTLLRRMLNPVTGILNPIHNPILRSLLNTVFYKQFCAGEHQTQVVDTIKNVKSIGYTGVILEYALEVLESTSDASSSEEIQTWRDGMLATIRMCSAGDFVALKWSGMGSEALQRLNAGEPPTIEMQAAITNICDLAVARQIALLPGAELEKTNVGIHRWTLDLQRKYNAKSFAKATIYTTYQAYLQSTAHHIARDLAMADEGNFILGVKLVRGAYLESEPRASLMKDKKATDDNYDAIIAALLSRTWNDTLRPLNECSTRMPSVAIVVATHNSRSIQRAQAIRREQAQRNQPMIECTYAQLQGMADELSCELIQEGKGSAVDQLTPRVYKFITWGTLSQCLNYLYRRALENQDAVSRTRQSRRAMLSELWMRVRSLIGRDP